MKRLLITGTSSSCGKTTITCAILAALIARGEKLTAFKCGPDYIDPMFHRAVLGTPAYNLDPFFLDKRGLRSHLSKRTSDMAVLEGAMGYYDGIAATDKASAYTVARETRTPVILVSSAKGANASLGAVIEGFVRHRSDSNISGVIFNDASDKRYIDLQNIAASVGVKAYGYLRRDEKLSIGSRQLGLLSPNEVSDIKGILTELGKQAEDTIDIDGLLKLAGTAPVLPTAQNPRINFDKGLRIAVARDEAFCFMYEENLELFKELGCELVFFSPLHDAALPSNIHGLFLCGGYPDIHAAALSQNTDMRKSIKCAVDNGLPTIAEGGGFMYLHDYFEDLPMCGVIPGKVFQTKKLTRFGYISLTAKYDNLLCKAGETIRSREYHYSDSTNNGAAFVAKKAGRDISYLCIHATETLYAGFPHLYFPANPSFAKDFVERMTSYER